MLLEGLHKTKTEKVKGKDVVRTKKPKRPSKRIEILSPYEEELVRGYERPFSDYKEFIKSLKNEVAINDVKKTRGRLRELIAQMWLVVERFSAPLTKRRTVMLATMSENERKKFTFNKAFIDKLRNEGFQSVITDGNSAYTLSPLPLIAKCNDKLAIDVNKCKVHQSYFFIPMNVSSEVFEITSDFCRTINFEVYRELVTKKPRRTHGASKENWKDDADYYEATTEISGVGSDLPPEKRD